MSQAEVARSLGVHVLTVNAWECGRKSPRYDVALSYSRLLDGLREVAG